MWDVLGLVCLIVTIVFTLYLVLALGWRMRRLTRLRAFAAEHHLQQERPERSLLSLTRGAPFASVSPPPRPPVVRTVFRGVWKRYSLVAFEFRRGLPMQVVSVTLPKSYPFLQVTVRLLGRQRVDVAGAVEHQTADDRFTTRYRADSTNDRFAEVVLTPDLRDWLSSGDRKKGFQWTVDGDRLVTWRHGPPDSQGGQSIPVMAEFLVGLADHIEDVTENIDFD
ncbi:hypothetical protein [Stackebrandtia soli]|uniref:hypothetical protein n=1 Tax=Stackebrandtia soli TaxID=1892856 RepID=UPI0039EA9CAC